VHLSPLAVYFFHRTLGSDGDFFAFAERALVDVFVGIESYGIDFLLAITTIERYFSSLLSEFFFLFFKSRDVDEIVVGSCHRKKVER